MSIKDNWKNFQEDLEKTAEQYNRDLHSITVMAVSKTRSIEEIHQAGISGLSIFGENRVEEASDKFAGLDPEKYPLYLIGHLQSNKVNRIDQRFAGVHSVDSLKVARLLSKNRERIESPLEILLQVNTSNESSKSGFIDQDLLIDAAAEITQMPYIKLRGLMTMAPFVDDEMIVRSCFSKCRDWSEAVEQFIDETLILSMGMSSDYKWAVAEGSTMLRIGTTLFGGRE